MRISIRATRLLAAVLLLLPFAKAHSFLLEPIADWRSVNRPHCRLGGPPGAPPDDCHGPCIPWGSWFMNKSAPTTIWQRGGQVIVKWARNNHRNGFVRLALVKRSNRMNFTAHEQAAFHYACWDGNMKACEEDQYCGTDVSLYETTATVPNVPDGDYVLGWTWFGGFGTDGVTRYNYADYWSCANIRVRGGHPVGNERTKPAFKSGHDVDSCSAMTNRIGDCRVEPCDDSDVPEGPRRWRPFGFSQVIKTPGPSLRPSPVRKSDPSMLPSTAPSPSTEPLAPPTPKPRASQNPRTLPKQSGPLMPRTPPPVPLLKPKTLQTPPPKASSKPPKPKTFSPAKPTPVPPPNPSPSKTPAPTPTHDPGDVISCPLPRGCPQRERHNKPYILALQLIPLNATGQRASFGQCLCDGTPVNASRYVHGFTIEAVVYGRTTSARFFVNGRLVRIERFLPYAIAHNNETYYSAYTPPRSTKPVLISADVRDAAGYYFGRRYVRVLFVDGVAGNATGVRVLGAVRSPRESRAPRAPRESEASRSPRASRTPEVRESRSPRASRAPQAPREPRASRSPRASASYASARSELSERLEREPWSERPSYKPRSTSGSKYNDMVQSINTDNEQEKTVDSEKDKDTVINIKRNLASENQEATERSRPFRMSGSDGTWLSWRTGR